MRAPWRWHDSVETCKIVVIYKLIVIVLLLVDLQNSKKKHGKCIKIKHLCLVSNLSPVSCSYAKKLLLNLCNSKIPYKKIHRRSRTLMANAVSTSSDFYWMLYLGGPQRCTHLVIHVCIYMYMRMCLEAYEIFGKKCCVNITKALNSFFHFFLHILSLSLSLSL